VSSVWLDCTVSVGNSRVCAHAAVMEKSELGNISINQVFSGGPCSVMSGALVDLNDAGS